MRTLFLILVLAGTALAQTVINGGRTITGAWDASGAATTKPVKAGTSLPATCAVGEQYFKTDATAGRNLYNCTATDTWTVAGKTPLVKAITVFDPVTGDDGRIQLMFDESVTITRVACSVKAATSVTINLDERAAATPDTSGTAVLTDALVCDTDQAVSTTFSNAGIAARVPVALLVSAVSGTPGTLRVFISYTVD